MKSQFSSMNTDNKDILHVLNSSNNTVKQTWSNW